MIAATCIGLLMVVAVAALAAQDAVWRARLDRQRADSDKQREADSAGLREIANEYATVIAEWEQRFDEATGTRLEAEAATRAALAAHAKARQEADDNEILLVVAAAEIERLTLGQPTAKVLPLRGRA